jgi:nucleoside phosphorylase
LLLYVVWRKADVIDRVPSMDRQNVSRQGRAGPKVHFGLMLSGEKLADNINFREQLRQLEPEAIGGEMEGAGLYAAAERNHVDWIVIKAISDWADGKKKYKKSQRQQIAEENAIQLVMHVLLQGGLRNASLI